MNVALAVTRHQLRILKSDPALLVIMFLMPLAIVPLMREALGVNLAAVGFEDADGSELVVAGQMVLFGFFVAGSATFSLFREHAGASGTALGHQRLRRRRRGAPLPAQAEPAASAALRFGSDPCPFRIGLSALRHLHKKM